VTLYQKVLGIDGDGNIFIYFSKIDGVMARAINVITGGFLWEKTHSINGFISVLITSCKGP
jgi:hypothetical protein